MAVLEDIGELRTRFPADELDLGLGVSDVSDLDSGVGDAVPIPTVFRADTTLLFADQTGFSADYLL